MVSAISRDFGKLVRQKRRELGLSRFALSEKVLISSQSIAGYENGVQEIAMTRAFALAEYLDINLDQFIDRKLDDTESLIRKNAPDEISKQALLQTLFEMRKAHGSRS